MRAVVYTRYGGPDVLELGEVETPTAGDGEILVRIHASAVTAADYRLRAMNVPAGFRILTRLMTGIRRPRNPILGRVVSGVVEAVGRDASSFRPGDEVFGLVGSASGGYAEYTVLPDDGALARKPAGLTYTEAAAIPFGGHTAFHFLRKAGVTAGERVLVYGASGDVGTAAVQLAKHLGADVTGVCSTRNLDLVRGLGADTVIDYTAGEVPPPGARYDVVVETVGKTRYPRWKPALAPGGRFVMISGGVPEFLRMIPTNLFGGHTIVAGVAAESREAVEFLRDRADAGELRPVIDRTYPLAQTADAHRYADTGHKVGSVVIEVKERC